MKNQFLLFLCFTFSLFCFSQRQYSFDYIIEYDFHLTEGFIVQKKYLLTNSLDNSYELCADEIENGYLNVKFKDERGIFALFSMKKEDLFNTLTINLKCDFVQKQIFLKENTIERYVFKINEDTIMDSQNYKLHSLKYKKKWESKRYDRGSAYYIVEKNTDFHLPLSIFSTSFDAWIRNPEIPNGIAKEIFTTNQKGNKKTQIYKLVSYKKINKFVTLPKECDLALRK